jgi:hypothetical protein
MHGKSYLFLFLISLMFAFFMQNIAAATSDPVLFFSDLTSGPKSGWEGSSTRGAAVTIWGENLGASGGSSYVTVNGNQLTLGSDYAEWGEDLGPARSLDRITFWLNRNCQDGAGQISVTVNGVTSNPLPFTVRSGNIYFIAKDGSDSYNGRFSTRSGHSGSDGPWQTIPMADASENPSLGPGDIVYIRQGTYTDADENGFMIRLRGYDLPTKDRPVAVGGYPGEWPVMGPGPSGFIKGEGAAPVYNSYYTVFKLLLRNSQGTGSWTGEGIRLVGIYNQDQLADKTASFYSGSGWDGKIYGCVWDNCGYDNWDHTIYLNTQWASQYGHTTENWDIGWNEFKNNPSDQPDQSQMGMPIINIRCNGQTSPESERTHDIYIHDNLCHDNPQSTFFKSEENTYNIFIYNNIITNAATYSGGSWGLCLGAITVTSSVNEDRFYVYNNVIHNSGNSGAGWGLLRLPLRNADH